MITPYYSHAGITIYHARNEQIVPFLPGVGALVGDPPYGGKYDMAYTRITGGQAANRDYAAVEGDDQPFDPTPWLDYPEVILWGYPHFANRVPLGTILVWGKRHPDTYGKMLSDAEIGWQKGGQGVYIFEHEWNGFMRASERGQRRIHPTQKPVALFVWAIQRLHLPPGTLILDPWMGSGPTLKAAKLLGYPAIGIESVETYCAAAAQDLAQEVLPPGGYRMTFTLHQRVRFVYAPTPGTKGPPPQVGATVVSGGAPRCRRSLSIRRAPCASAPYARPGPSATGRRGLPLISNRRRFVDD